MVYFGADLLLFWYLPAKWITDNNSKYSDWFILCLIIHNVIYFQNARIRWGKRKKRSAYPCTWQKEQSVGWKRKMCCNVNTCQNELTNCIRPTINHYNYLIQQHCPTLYFHFIWEMNPIKALTMKKISYKSINYHNFVS